MWKHLLVAVTVSVGLTGFAPAPLPDVEREKKSEQEKTRLQGTWTVDEFSQGSAPVSGSIPNRIQINRDQWIVTQSGGAFSPQNVEFQGRVALGGRVSKGSYMYMPETTTIYRVTLDPRRSPGAIDLIVDGNSGKRVVYRGIYRVKGNEMTVCYRESDGAARPKSFDDRAGRTVLLKLRKASGSGYPVTTTPYTIITR